MIELSRVADDKKAGMSLKDMWEFLAEAGLKGLPDDARVSAAVGFKGQIQKLKVSG